MSHSLGGRSCGEIVGVIVPGPPPGLTPARAAWALSFELDAAGRRRRFGHLPGGAEKRVPLAAGQGRVASRQCDRAADFSRPHPRTGPLEPQSGCSRVMSVVFCDGKDVCSRLIGHFCRTTRNLGSLHCKGLELYLRVQKTRK